MGAADSERKLGAENHGVILKKLIEDAIGESQPVEIIFAAQDQIVKLRQKITQPRFHIHAAEIEAVVFVVIKKLLPDIDKPVERLGDPRLIKNSRNRRC